MYNFTIIEYKNLSIFHVYNSCFISLVKSLIYIANRVGDKESPWHTPLCVGNQCVPFEFNLTPESGWLYMALMQL